MIAKKYLLIIICGLCLPVCFFSQDRTIRAETPKTPKAPKAPNTPQAPQTPHLLCSGPQPTITNRWFFYGDWRPAPQFFFVNVDQTLPYVQITRVPDRTSIICKPLALGEKEVVAEDKSKPKVEIKPQVLPSVDKQDLIKKMLASALDKLRGMGFSSPLGWRPLEEKTSSIWVRVDPNPEAAPGATLIENLTCDQRYRPLVAAHLEVAESTFNKKNQAIASIVASHELFHMIQYTRFFTGFCGGFPHEGAATLTRFSSFNFQHQDFQETMWFMESSADAVSHTSISMPTTAKDKKGLSFWIFDRLFRNYFVYPLHFYKRNKEKRIEDVDVRLAAYRTQFFWHHIARLYFAHKPGETKYTFLEDVMRQRFQRVMASTKSNQERPIPAYHLWLTELEQYFRGSLAMPLSHVFAIFMGALASRLHLTARQSQLLQDFGLPISLLGGFNKEQFKALQILGLLKTFGLCESVTISGKSGQAEVEIPLSMYTAKCIMVNVKGRKDGAEQAVSSVKIKAVDDNAAHLDQLHLTLASTTDRSQFNCEQSLQKMAQEGRLTAQSRGSKATRKERSHYLDNCLMLPEKTLQVSQGETATAKGQQVPHQRVWNAFAQRTPEGKDSFSDLYVLSRSPVARTIQGIEHAIPKAKGADAAVPLAGRKKFKLVIVLNAATIQRTSAGQAKKKGKQASSGGGRQIAMARLNPLIQTHDDLVGIPHEDPAQASLLPRHNILKSFSGLRVNQMIKQGLKQVKHGDVFSLTWQGVVEKHPGTHIGEFASRHVVDYTFFPKDPIKLGKVGAIKGVLFGRFTEPAKEHLLWISQLSTKGLKHSVLHIHTFSKDLLQASLSGPLCQINLNNNMKAWSIKDLCQRQVSFRGTISKPFPLMYLPKASIRTKETPGWKEYQRFQIQPLQRNWQGTNGAAPSGNATTKQPKAAPVKEACQCDCRQKKEIQALTASLMRNQKPTHLARLQTRLQALVQCQAKCMMKGVQCPD